MDKLETLTKDELIAMNKDQAITIDSLKRALAASDEELRTVLKTVRIVNRHADKFSAGIAPGASISSTFGLGENTGGF